MKRYKSYKSSDIDWIGEVPNQWSVIRGKYLFSNIVDRNHPEYPLLSVTQKDSVVRRDEMENRVWNPDSDISGYKLIKKGDFVISLRTFEGGIELSEIEGIVSPVYSVLRRKLQIGERYYKYLLKSPNLITELNTITTGIRQGKNISFDDFSNLFLPFPNYEEQIQIGDFLDKRTELINKLISTKERKITLLKEQRTSLINQIVTKGLNPNVKMKDIGVEWIGKIPEVWDVFKMKYGVNYINEKGITLKGDVKISPENVEPMTGLCFNYHSEYEGEGMKFKKGDILLNKLRLYLKKIVFTEMDGFSMGEMIVLRCKENLFNRYFYYLIFHQGLIDLLDSQSNGVKLPRVSPEIILNSIISFPPIIEQVEIVNYLDSKTKEIDDLVHLEQKKIDLLKQYRQSLISEVVTGKIKVTTDE